MTEILDASAIDFDLETTCVVVGAGACGLIAALRLADAGVETLVLERDAKPYGSTSMSSGFIPAAGTRLQSTLNVADSPAQFAEDIQRKAGHEADPAIVRAVTDKAGAVLDWLAHQHGFDWVLLDDFLYPGHTAFRMHAVPEKSGAALLNQLLRVAENADINIATRAHVDALILEKNEAIAEAVCGVRVRRPDGSHEHIRSAAVILACNGYGASPQLLGRFIPEMATAYYHGHAGNTGDAIFWAEKLGIPLVHMGAYQGHGSVTAGYKILITWALMMEGGVQVNQEGMRFSNEHAGYSEQAEKVIGQPDGIVWNMFDQRLHELGLSFPDYRDAFEAGAVISATDARILATATGLPEDKLGHTLAHIDKLAHSGGADEFGRVFDSAKTLRPPYYAVKVEAALFHTQGGLAIDTSARVLNAGGTPVKNLYAAGGAAVGVSGSTVSGYLSGNGLLTAVTLGAIAADTVVQQQQESSS